MLLNWPKLNVVFNPKPIFVAVVIAVVVMVVGDMILNSSNIRI